MPNSVSSFNETSTFHPASPTMPTSNKLDLYKTELCARYMQYGGCRYGQKCQFAHGESELRRVQRHPKYKTTRCKSFWGKGECPYGIRCKFIHDEDLYMNSTDLQDKTRQAYAQLLTTSRKETQDQSLAMRECKHIGHFSSGKQASSVAPITMSANGTVSYMGEEENYRTGYQLWRSQPLQGNTSKEFDLSSSPLQSFLCDNESEEMQTLQLNLRESRHNAVGSGAVNPEEGYREQYHSWRKHFTSSNSVNLDDDVEDDMFSSSFQSVLNFLDKDFGSPVSTACASEDWNMSPISLN